MRRQTDRASTATAAPERTNKAIAASNGFPSLGTKASRSISKGIPGSSGCSAWKAASFRFDRLAQCRESLGARRELPAAERDDLRLDRA